MITDAKLLCTLMSNVLRGIVELARHADHRDYIWRIRFDNHVYQLNEYHLQLYLLEAEPDIHVDCAPEPYKLIGIHSDVSEGYTNLGYVFQNREQEKVTMPIRQILTIESVPPAGKIPAHMIN